MISLDISDKVRLFDSTVLPILCYGSEVWGFDKERVHTKFLKQLLFVRQQTINVCMYVCMVRLVVFRYIFTDK